MTAVISQQLQDSKSLQPDDQYIHYSAIEHGIPLVVTFRTGLAQRIHAAREIFHDFTYKRVHGQWKEWEVVIWDEATDCHDSCVHCRMRCCAHRSEYFLLLLIIQSALGITVAHIYGQLETREAYHHMWSLLWDTVGHATKELVKFKPFSGNGAGICAILVDGNKEQVDTCGDDLVKRNDLTISGLNISDPQEIVKYIVKLCMVHFDRYVLICSH